MTARNRQPVRSNTAPRETTVQKSASFTNLAPGFFCARDRVETQLLRDSEAETILRLPMRRVGRPWVVRPITPTPKPWPVRGHARPRTPAPTAVGVLAPVTSHVWRRRYQPLHVRVLRGLKPFGFSPRISKIVSTETAFSLSHWSRGFPIEVMDFGKQAIFAFPG